MMVFGRASGRSFIDHADTTAVMHRFPRRELSQNFPVAGLKIWEYLVGRSRIRDDQMTLLQIAYLCLAAGAFIPLLAT
ncbi:hypothetical protein AJ88_15890 [Mesorhizobium amorphae CCBAU 01583]|nr:hypothetical protein AJ88_15890 [Mesorhizobium amorphae CCBAU 01583]